MKLYKKVVYETLDFIKREMTDESRGFLLFTRCGSRKKKENYIPGAKQEIEEYLVKLSNPLRLLILQSEKGNWEHGKNILSITQNKD